MKKDEIKKQKLEFIDKIDSIVNTKLVFSNQKIKNRCCGGVSDDYVKGFNSALHIMHYNIGLERKFVENDVTCGYDLAVKTNKLKQKI